MGRDELIRKIVDKVMPKFRAMILADVSRLRALGEPASIELVLSAYEEDMRNRQAEMRAFWISEGEDPDVREAVWKEFFRRMRIESGS